MTEIARKKEGDKKELILVPIKLTFLETMKVYEF